MTNLVQIAATLEALAAKVTPGEWEVEQPLDHELWLVEAGLPNPEWRVISGLPFPDEKGDIPKRQVEANAALIVALRNNLPTIITALKAMEEQTDGE